MGDCSNQCNIMRNFNVSDLAVYFVLDPHCCGGRDIEWVAHKVAQGGVTMVQLRNKEDSIDIIRAQALALKDIFLHYGVPFVLNDYVDLAAELDLDGVHIGQDDMKPQDARAFIGAYKILGLTAFEFAHFDAIDPNIIDYAGTGPFFATLTKPDKPVLGGHGFTNLIKMSCVPVVGIGGITPQNAGDVMACGAKGVAMMRSVSMAEDPADAVDEFVRVVRGYV